MDERFYKHLDSRRIRALMCMNVIALFALACGENGRAFDDNDDNPHRQASDSALVAPVIHSFSLINADTDLPFAKFDPISSGSVVNLAELESNRINVRANVGSGVESVRFVVDQASARVENQPPYAVGGDNKGDFFSWSVALGTHTISAEPYSADGATGTVGQALTVSLRIQDEATNGVVLSGALKKWHPLTITFDGPFSSEADNSPNPFLDYRLVVTLTAPSGRILKVPGFFDGDGNGGGSGNKWRIRFSPDEAGTWMVHASFRSGASVAIDPSPSAGTPTSFDGKSATFVVAARDPLAPGFLRDGRLEYTNKGYLKTRDGSYWIKTGADEPENFLAYSGFDATQASHSYLAHVQDWTGQDPDWGSGKGKGIVGALNYLASERVNSIYFLPMNIGGDGKDVWPFVGPIDPAGSATNDNRHYDISKLSQWEIVFLHAQRKGIHLHFVLNEAEAANKRELDGGTLGKERKLYYRELVARFGHHNAITWNLCEEYDLNFATSGLFTPEQIKSFAAWIRDVDPYDHPITVHNASVDAWDAFVGDPRFDALSYQYYPDNLESNKKPYGTRVEELSAKTKAGGRPVAVFLDEGNTVGPTDDDRISAVWPYTSGQTRMRKAFVWPILFSGGAGIEFFTRNLGSQDDFRPFSAMWKYARHARSFMQDNLPFWEMVPRDSLLIGETKDTGGPRSSGEGGQVFAKGNALYAIYYPNATNTGVLAESGSFERRWFNPRTGAFEGTATLVNTSGSLTIGSPPREGDQDWVVLLRRVGPGVIGEVMGFTLMDADTNADVGSLVDGATINLKTLPSRNLAIRANTSPATVGSVVFFWDNQRHAENAAPYVFPGNNGIDVFAFTPSVGTHILTAQAFESASGLGASGSVRRIEVIAVDP